MIGFTASLTWRDDQGEVHRLPGWTSRSFVGGERHDDGSWFGLVARRGVLSMSGDGYPTVYDVHVSALVELLRSPSARELRECSLTDGPIDAEALVRALVALPPGTTVRVEEWDQS